MRKIDKNVAFRVDASYRIGTGHFMRCLTLADGLRRAGALTRFVCRHLPEHLRARLSESGHEFAFLDPEPESGPIDELAHAAWLGVAQQKDASATLRALSDRRWDWLVVDHYALDRRWEAPLRQVTEHILAIDDIADRQHDCDVLLDQNLHTDMETRYSGRVPPHCRLLLGPRYALLQEEFRTLRGRVRPRNGPVGRILVFFGGVDADDFTGRTIRTLGEMELGGIHVDVVIGAQHPFRAEIVAACARHGFVCHVQTERMAELMAAADLAIGAGGIACLERFCLGLPSLVVITADNQLQQVSGAASRGLLYAPDQTGKLFEILGSHVTALIGNRRLRHFMSALGMQTVIGNGVGEVMTHMGFTEVTVREAGPGDSGRLFAWRNHPLIQAVSRNPGEIGLAEHAHWFASVLADTERALLIGEIGGDPVGVVRFDIAGEEAVISIYLVPEKMSSGLGPSLLQGAENWLLANRPHISRLRAHVIGENQRSQRFFSRAGYRIESMDYLKRLY